MDEIDDATLSLVAHNLRGSIGIAASAVRTVRLRWDQLDPARRSELLELVERGMARIDDAAFGLARGLPAPVIVELQRGFEDDDTPPPPPPVPADRPYPVPADEEDRLAALRRYAVLDQPEAADLDAVVRLAAKLAGTPRAIINLIDAERQWSAAAFGEQRGDIPREQSMCAFAIMERATVHVPDASRDDRFRTHPQVTGALSNIRLYAAAPLVATGSHVVGTICVVDERPRALSEAEIAGLEDLARVVSALFEQRALAAELRAAAAWQHELIGDLDRERRRNEHLLDRLGGSGSMGA
jgi:hypothetical protein